MKRTISFSFLFFILMVCSSSVFAENVSENKKRIVSVGGGLTEIIFALGAQGTLVGVDTTSKYPTEATALPQVGYQRRLSAEGVLSLNPSLLMVTTDAGPEDVLQKIKGAGVPIITLSKEYTVEGVLKNIEKVAKALGKVDEGHALIKKIKSDYIKVTESLPESDKKPSVAFFISLAKGSPMAGGKDSSADHMIRMAGGKNAFQSFTSYKPISQESMIVASPEVILIARHAAKGMSDADLYSHKSLSQTPAAKNKKIIVVDTLLMLGYGPRIAEAIGVVSKQIHSGK